VSAFVPARRLTFHIPHFVASLVSPSPVGSGDAPTPERTAASADSSIPSALYAINSPKLPRGAERSCE